MARAQVLARSHRSPITSTPVHWPKLLIFSPRICPDWRRWWILELESGFINDGCRPPDRRPTYSELPGKSGSVMQVFSRPVQPLHPPYLPQPLQAAISSVVNRIPTCAAFGAMAFVNKKPKETFLRKTYTCTQTSFSQHTTYT